MDGNLGLRANGRWRERLCQIRCKSRSRWGGSRWAFRPLSRHLLRKANLQVHGPRRAKPLYDQRSSKHFSRSFSFFFEQKVTSNQYPLQNLARKRDLASQIAVCLVPREPKISFLHVILFDYAQY